MSQTTTEIVAEWARTTSGIKRAFVVSHRGRNDYFITPLTDHWDSDLSDRIANFIIKLVRDYQMSDFDIMQIPDWDTETFLPPDHQQIYPES
jgi:hypothetical protein